VRGLEDLLRAAGARRVRLMHTAENVQLHRFYLRLGYEPVGEDPAPDGGFGTIYMERDL